MVTLELRFGKIMLLKILLTKGATNRIVFDFVFDVAHKESGVARCGLWGCWASVAVSKKCVTDSFLILFSNFLSVVDYKM